MKTQTTDAMRPVTSINPDFTHRFASSIYDDSADLTDSIGLMTDRALSVLALISGKFENNKSIVNNDVIYLALSSVEQEILDIQAYLKAYSDAQAIKNPR